MNAELIAVGSELLRLGRPDTNGDWLAERLQRLGVTVVARSTVGDELEHIVDSLLTALGRADLVLVTGGLGPTEDDRTREALARALGVELQRDETRVERLREQFAVRGFTFRPLQARQADRPRGAEFLDNPLGTAAGILVRRGEGRLLAALPGVPPEMRRMFDDGVVPEIAAAGAAHIVRRTLKIAGRIEASVDAQLSDLYGVDGVEATILAGPEGIELHLFAAADDAEQAASRADGVARRMAERLGDDLYASDDRPLAAVVGAALCSAGLTVAVAESCTAGGLAAALTSVAGSSAWFRGGFVTYADDLKVDLAGVDADLLVRHGAVSEAVAVALAHGARTRCTAALGVGITGIAGPGGGSAEKPVGLIHVALAAVGETRHWALRQVGDRELIRRRSVAFALDRLRRHAAGLT